MRRFLILCVLLVLAVPPALAQKGIISIGDYTAKPGDTISVDIMMDENVKNVAGIQLTVEFRESTVAGAPPLVALENPQKPGSGEADLTRGPKVPAGAFVLGNAKVAGELKVGIVGTEGFSGPGPLITFKLSIPANAPQGAKYTLHLKDAVVNDPDVNPIDVDLKDGSVTIPAPPPPPPPPVQKGVISIGDYEAKPGDTISVDIMMDENVKNAAGVQLVVEFRESTVAGAPPLVALEDPQKPGSGEADLTRGAQVPAGVIVSGNARVAGELRIAVAGVEGFSGPGKLVSFKLSIPSNAPQGARYTLHLKEVAVKDPEVNPIEVELKDGSVTILAPPPPPSAVNILLLGTHVLRPGVPGKVVFQIDKPEKAAGAEFVIEYDPAFVTFDATSATSFDPATARVDVNLDFEDPEGKIKPSDPANKLMKVAVASAKPISAGPLLSIDATVSEKAAPWQSKTLTLVADTLKYRDVEGAEVPGASAGPAVLVAGSKTAGWSLQTGTSISSSVSSAGDRVVVVGDDGKALVLNIADGSSAVKTSPTLPGAVDGRPVISGGRISIETVGDKTVVTLRDAGVFAATKAGDVVAFNLDDGSERFAPAKFAEGAKVVPGFFPDKGAVLYVADDAKVTVLDQAGAQVASVPLDANLGTITAPPVFAFGRLWLGTSTGNVVALEPKDGSLQTVVNFPTGNAPIIAAPFAYLENPADPNSLNLIVANQGGTVFKISASGEEKAKLIPDAAEKVSAAPFVLGDKVFVLYDSGELYIANLGDLSKVNKVKVASAVGANQSVAVFGSTLYVGDQDGKFHAVNIADPANPKITTVDLLSGAVSSPAVGGVIEVVDGKAQLKDLQVVVATANGTVVALPLL